ncbi:MAG: hypothetical protein CK425_10650 [Parachlamydia sp.]|nr:MAG: hypothetical protein CK425_10650 [Parachlamydia sp.]
MTAFREKFAEILTLTHFYLLQEHQLKDVVFSNQETFQHFKKWRDAQKKQPQILAPVQPHPIARGAAPAAPQISRPPLPLPPAIQEKKTELLKPEEKRKETPKISTTELALEPPPIPMEDTCESMRALFKETFPSKTILTEIPDDAESIQKSTLWKYQKEPSPITILAFNEKPNHEAFLRNLSKAIEHINPAVEVRTALTIEAANEWEGFLKSKSLKLIIASDIGMQACPNLMKFYRETQKHAYHYLDRIPLFLLSDISFYLKEPKLKQPLWQALREILSMLSKKQ